MGISRILKWVWLPALLAAAGVIWYFTRANDSQPQYQTATVARGDIIQAVTATGTLNPVLNVQVGSQISGIIQNLYADFNTTVKSNQVIAQLDPATFQANVAQAEGDLANANANRELMQIQAKRAEELFKNKLIAESDHDTAIANLHQAQAQVKIKEASLSNAQVTLRRCTIYAPVDGVVISRSVDVGQTVAASLSAPVLFQIANDLTKMQIDSNVAEADVGGVEVGQNVNFTVDAFPGRTFTGKVVQIRNSPITVQNVVTYDTVIEVSNPDLKLKPGMTANASIVTAQRFDVLKIPNGALRFRPPEALGDKKTNTTSVAKSTVGGQSSGGNRSGDGGRGGAGGSGARQHGERRSARTVCILKDAKLQPIQIKTGITDGLMTEVTEGLNENDKIITSSITQQSGPTPAPASNPFSGGMRRF